MVTNIGPGATHETNWRIMKLSVVGILVRNWWKNKNYRSLKGTDQLVKKVIESIETIREEDLTRRTTDKASRVIIIIKNCIWC